MLSKMFKICCFLSVLITSGVIGRSFKSKAENNQIAVNPPEIGNKWSPNSIKACIKSCRVTAEYNPVCGTDLLKYNNPGRLTCAQSCGVDVTLLKVGACPGMFPHTKLP